MVIQKENKIVLQILRALAILLVLIHHSLVNVNVSSVGLNIDNIIICFHMPVFFLISGYLFECKIKKYVENGYLQFIKKKFKHLIIPYLFWTVLLWIGVQFFCIINKPFMMKIGFPPMSVIDLLKGIFTYKIYYTQHLWFLYVLFVMFVINIIFSKINKKFLLFISIILGFLTVVISFPNIINRLFLWLPFFILGRCVVNSKRLISKKANKSIIAIFIFTILSILRIMLPSSNFLYVKIINRIIMYEIGIVGSYLLYLMSFIICNSKLRQIFVKIGDYSYEIYLIHNPYFVATSSILLSSILKLPAILCIIISVFLGIMFPSLITKFIIRYFKKATFILGK